LYVFVGAFPTYNISDLKAFTFQTFADIEAEDGPLRANDHETSESEEFSLGA
jgi:hypothetical protein